ncbi:MAG TPA: hypothetical protein VMQ65_08915 [Candidatus Limnocylindria bacterium]|nr:hypothetical protein [Candidatus Limnocylindria bacterium]
MSITAFDGIDVSAAGVVHYYVEATGADRGPFDILVSFQGSVTDDIGGLATIAVTVEEGTRTFTSPEGGADIRLDFPLTVVPGDAFRVELRVNANSTDESNDLSPHGSITIAQPPEIIVYAVECPET